MLGQGPGGQELMKAVESGSVVARDVLALTHTAPVSPASRQTVVLSPLKMPHLRSQLKSAVSGFTPKPVLLTVGHKPLASALPSRTVPRCSLH